MTAARVRVLAGSAVAAVLLAGCGTGEPPTPPGAALTTASTTTSTTASTTGPAPSPVPTDGADLTRRAFDLLGTVSSFHATLQSPSQGFDVIFGDGGAAMTSTTSDSSGAVDVRRLVDGTEYVRADERYLVAAGADPAVASAVGGRWVLVDTDAPDYLSLAAVVADRDRFVSIMGLGNGADVTRTVTGPTPVKGVPAFVVTIPDGSTVAVAAVGDPLPIRATSGGGGGSVEFDGYGDPVTVEAPPAEEIAEIPG